MESPHLVQTDDADGKLNEEERRFLLAKFVREDDTLMEILTGLRALDLPDWRLVAGSIYQTVWNRLTGKPQGHGIKDFDVAYFDDQDLSYEAEDLVIKRVEAAMPHLADRLETRNQARVHLWYPDRFGSDYPQLTCTDESLEHYMCITHSVAVRLEADDSISVVAPFGLKDIFSITMRPCPDRKNNQAAYNKKAKGMARLWPELKILDWQTGEPVHPDVL